MGGGVKTTKLLLALNDKKVLNGFYCNVARNKKRVVKDLTLERHICLI